MKTNWLFPYYFRYIGWLLFAVCAVLSVLTMTEDLQFSFLTVPVSIESFPGSHTFVNLTDELEAVGLIIGLLFIGFAREKVEDEMISHLRLEALQWSVYANYFILIVLVLAVHGVDFLLVAVYNMFTVLVVFVLRFRWLVFATTNLRYEKSTES